MDDEKIWKIIFYSCSDVEEYKRNCCGREKVKAEIWMTCHKSEV
jgi:hypothetical protein